MENLSGAEHGHFQHDTLVSMIIMLSHAVLNDHDTHITI